MTARVGGRAVTKRHIRAADHQKLTTEIGGLAMLSNNELKVRGRAVYGTAAPTRMKRDLLRYAVAYRMQECALGGLKPSTHRLFEHVADDAGARRHVKVTPTCKVQAGAVLLRKWGGVNHQVTVLENGVLFCGERHRSLSEVVRVITGRSWSGPLFFGLKAQARAAPADGTR
jgi:hypothetical protein